MDLIFKAVKEYFGEFGKLLKLPKEFWAVQALNMLFMLMYFAFATISTLHSSQDAGFSDEAAGVLFGLFVTGNAVIMIFMGPLVDKWGYRKTPLIAGAIITVGMLGVGFSPYFFGASKTAQVLLVISYVIATIGVGMMTPVVMAGTKRFSNRETQGAAYNFWYLSMNVGAILVVTIDLLRRPLENNPTAAQVMAYREAGGNLPLLLYFAALAALCWLIVFFFVKQTRQFPDFERREREPDLPKKGFAQLVREVIRDKDFRKVLALLMLTIPAHMPFVFVFVLFPKVWLRVISPDLNLGFIESLNPMIIVSGLVLFAPLVKRFNIFWILVVGMFLGGGSILVLAIPPHLVADVFGTNPTAAYMTMIYIQIVFFSAGEFIWSPQLVNYVAAAAPKGKEGTFMGFSRVPFTIAKLITSLASGFLLASFCPEDIKVKLEAGTVNFFQTPWFMFLILGLVILSSPVLLLVFKKTFYVEAKAKAETDHD